MLRLECHKFPYKICFHLVWDSEMVIIHFTEKYKLLPKRGRILSRLFRGVAYFYSLVACRLVMNLSEDNNA